MPSPHQMRGSSELPLLARDVPKGNESGCGGEMIRKVIEWPRTGEIHSMRLSIGGEPEEFCLGLGECLPARAATP
jgi:hypothetical protein